MSRAVTITPVSFSQSKPVAFRESAADITETLATTFGGADRNNAGRVEDAYLRRCLAGSRTTKAFLWRNHLTSCKSHISPRTSNGVAVIAAAQQ